MAIFKRVADVAKSNLSALRDKVTGRELESYTDEELLAEIERRRLERRAKEEQEAREAAHPETRGKKKEKRGKEKPVGRRKEEGPTDELGRAYASLELDRDAPLDAVKRQYRKLIRRYHPDRHVGDPEKHEVATVLAQKLTKAYMRIREHLERERKGGGS